MSVAPSSPAPQQRPSADPGAPGIAASLDQTIWRERQRALGALLMSPLLSAQGSRAAEFGLVRRHVVWLREWLARHPGWTLQVDSEFARMRKTPVNLQDSTRPARDPEGGPAFSRRRYVLLCLTLAVLERADRQTILGNLAEQVLTFCASDPSLLATGFSFDLESRDQRRDLAEVMKFLMSLRVLVRVAGEESQYISGQGDVLYTINRTALTMMLNVRRSPVTIEAKDLRGRLRALCEEPMPDTPEGRNRRTRSALMRRLLDDPIVYYAELSDEERTYLATQRPNLVRHIEEATGLVPEVRSEGMAMADRSSNLTDFGMAEEGTDSHVTLLLAEHLAGLLRNKHEGPVGHAALHLHVADLIQTHRAHWRKDVGEPGAEVELTDQAIDRLAALRLLTIETEGVLPLPAIARYALVESQPGGGAR